MSIETTLPGFDASPLLLKGQTARITERKRRLLNGGRHPATGLELLPGDKTCGDCAFFLRFDGHKTYFKCSQVRIAHSAQTDIRKSWPACKAFELPVVESAP